MNLATPHSGVECRRSLYWTVGTDRAPLHPPKMAPLLITIRRPVLLAVCQPCVKTWQ